MQDELACCACDRISDTRCTGRYRSSSHDMDEVCGGKLGRMWRLILGRPAGAIFVMASVALVMAPNAPAQNQKWVQLFNGKNLDGWAPKFSGFDLGVNYNDTFRVENGLLIVSYDKWANFGDPPHFGHLFYKDKKFSRYVVAVEYRFVGEQVKGGPGWALRNNGVMLHCQPPETMGKNQDFPISVEAQLLAGGPTGDRTTANMCSPGTEVYRNGVKVPSHCINSTSKTYRDGEWVRVEIEVHGADRIVHRIDGNTVLEYGKLEIGGGNVIHHDASVKKDGTPLTEGYLAIQAESAPTQFRKIEIMELRK
jgi:Domain of Unknown Function (DUF1080)